MFNFLINAVGQLWGKQKSEIPKQSSTNLTEKKARLKNEEPMEKPDEDTMVSLSDLDVEMERTVETGELGLKEGEPSEEIEKNEEPVENPDEDKMISTNDLDVEMERTVGIGELELKEGEPSKDIEERMQIETRAQKRNREMRKAGIHFEEAKVPKEPELEEWEEEEEEEQRKKRKKMNKKKRDIKKYKLARTLLTLPDQVPEQGADLLPNIKGKNISDEDMVKLLRALGCNMDKSYDSDDSIFSDIDFMTPAEIAEKDARFKRTIEYIDNVMAARIKARNHVETPEEEEERNRQLYFQLHELKTQEEQEKALRKRAAKKARTAKLKATNVQVFEDDWKELRNMGCPTRMLTPHKFDKYLEKILDSIPDEKKSAAEKGNINHLEQFMAVDLTEMEKRS